MPRDVQGHTTLIGAATHLPVTLSEMLDKFHQVCRVSDDFKVEFLN